MSDRRSTDHGVFHFDNAASSDQVRGASGSAISSSLLMSCTLPGVRVIRPVGPLGHDYIRDTSV